MNARKWFACALFVGATAVSATAVELATEQRDKLVKLDQSLQRVVSLYRERKLDEMKKLIGEIETSLGEVGNAAEAGASLDPVLAPFRARLAAAQKLANYVPAPPPTAGAAPRMPGAPVASGTRPGRPGRPMPSGTGGAVSFAKEVAPIFLAKCNGCHVRGNSGDFSMANYMALMAGVRGESRVVWVKQGKDSPIVEKMASGEMPPNGNKVTPEELAVITKWIDEGAMLDSGLNATMALAALVPGGGPGAGGVARATGNEKFLFMRDVAPILIDNCFQCHGASNPGDNSDNFGMHRFSDLMRGGQNGSVITPGNAEGSVFVRMLRGTQKGQNNELRQRMPARSSPLDDEDMNKIVTWINEGAKFDGDDPQMSIELAWRIAQAKKATHEELSASRLSTAKKNWATANPDSPSEVIETQDFVLIGDLGSARMQEAQKVIETERARIAAAFKLPANQPLMKGRLTIYLFDKGFEHKEFGRVIENRELPQSFSSHWMFNYIDAYACVVVPPEKTDTIAPLFDETIVGALLDSRGSEMPRWFAVGAARNIAASMHRQNPIGKQWEDAALGARTSGLTPDAILSTRNPDAVTAAIAQAFVKELMKAPAWSSLLGNLLNGVRFDGAFNQAYRGAPQPLLTNWLRRG
mgnify:CR=1 FL=1